MACASCAAGEMDRDARMSACDEPGAIGGAFARGDVCSSVERAHVRELLGELAAERDRHSLAEALRLEDHVALGRIRFSERVLVCGDALDVDLRIAAECEQATPSY